MQLTPDNSNFERKRKKIWVVESELSEKQAGRENEFSSIIAVGSSYREWIEQLAWRENEFSSS